jgi:hypothetical protein
MTVYSLLAADSGVTAITTKIYTSQAPQGTTPPYVVVRIINTNPENLLAEVPNIESQYTGIECIGTDQSGSVSLFLACRAALEPHGYMQGLPIYGDRDAETGYYRTLMDYSYWNSR